MDNHNLSFEGRITLAKSILSVNLAYSLKTTYPFAILLIQNTWILFGEVMIKIGVCIWSLGRL